MKISIKRENNKVRFEFHHSAGDLVFLSSVDGADKLIEKIQKVCSEIDGKTRNEKSEYDIMRDLFGGGLCQKKFKRG